MGSFAAFRAEKYFASLDGLRAVSILLVLTGHSEVVALHRLNGHTGVTVFFVISGFLITTLLIREERTRGGGADLVGFYIRRAFRLMPLYLLALALTSLGVALGLAENSGDFFGERMLLFLTFLNEFAPGATFGHTWSLAIEEKFYILWPLLAFAVPIAARVRLWAAGLLVIATAVVGIWLSDAGYFGIYTPILAGCLLAIAADTENGFAVARALGRTVPGWAFVALSVGLILIAPDGHTQVLVGLAVACAFPFLLLNPGPARRFLSRRWIVWAGQRAYAVYLFHPLVGSAAAVVVPTSTVPFQVVHLVIMTAGSFLLAEVLYRVVERPLIRFGRRLSHKHAEKRQAAQTVPIRQADASPA